MAPTLNQATAFYIPYVETYYQLQVQNTRFVLVRAV